jgi:hypothetical protein
VVHDRAVKDVNELSPFRPAAWRATDGQADLPENFPIQSISESELHVIEEFLSRRMELANRSTLARHILASVLTRLNLPAESVNLSRAESILAEMYRARRSVLDEPQLE